MKIKKGVKIALLAAILLIIIIGIILIIANSNEKPKEPTYTITNDSIKFQNEYKSLNGKKVSKKSDNTYLEISIKSYSPVIYATYENVFNLFENKGTGIVYFGFPECPWCRNFVPILMDSAWNYGIPNDILYLNIKDDRDETEEKDGKKVTIKEATDDYKKLLSLINEKTTLDLLVDRIYMPTVLFIKKGKLIHYQESLNSFVVRADGNPWQSMNSEEKQELKDILNKYYEKLY